MDSKQGSLALLFEARIFFSFFFFFGGKMEPQKKYVCLQIKVEVNQWSRIRKAANYSPEHVRKTLWGIQPNTCSQEHLVTVKARALPSFPPLWSRTTARREYVAQLSKLLQRGDHIGQMSETSQGEWLANIPDYPISAPKTSIPSCQ